MGVDSTAAGPSGGPSRLRYDAIFQALPTACLVVSPDLVIRGVNEAYLQTVGRGRDELVGRPVLEALPPGPEALDESGVSHVQRSLERARDSGLPDTLPIQRYDVVDPATGDHVEEFWSLVSVPVLDEQGRTELVLQRAENLTDYYVRAQELRAARAAEVRASNRLAALADVALELAQATTETELVTVIVDRGLVAIGADGGALAMRDETDVLHLTISRTLSDKRRRFREMPLDAPLVNAVAARTGERVLLPDEQATLALSPQMRGAVDATGCVAWAALPIAMGGQVLGSLTAGWRQPHTCDAGELEVLDALAAQCAHALERIRARAAERATAEAAQGMSETLQRSLLTDPPQPPGLRLVVRYRPAAEQAQVGGDWYDAFRAGDGSTCVVIGDVAGHDRDAAAAMGQVRNVLRGVAVAGGARPGAVLATLDRALDVLAFGSLATAVLARVVRSPDGGQLLQWSNAGHPPPLVVEPGGRVRLLTTPADLLLGLDPGAERHDHEVALAPGSVLLLFTDGLIERRDAGIDDGLAWLQDAVATLAWSDVGSLVDALLAQVAGHAEDDIALLAMHVVDA